MGTRPNLSDQEQDQDQILLAWDQSYNKTSLRSCHWCTDDITEYYWSLL